MKVDEQDNWAAAVGKPLEQASTLPPHAYTSADFFAAEVESCFDGSWLFVGTADQWDEPGQFRVQATPLGEVIVVRDGDGELRAFFNACRHRGSALVEADGQCARFVCPYHSWRYDLKGELLSAPGMDGVEGFEPGDHGLLPLRIAQCGSLVFINSQRDGPTLETWLGDLPAQFANHVDTTWHCVRRVEFDVACNWKLLLENALEAYHTGTVHRDTLGRQASRPIPARGEWCGLFVPSERSIAVLPGESAPFPEVDDRGETAFTVVYPNTQLVFANDCFWWLQVVPTGVETCRLTLGSCFPRATVAAEGFDAAVEAYYRRWDEATPEDNRIAELQQIGQRVRARPAGRFAKEEFAVHAFAKWIAGRVER